VMQPPLAIRFLIADANLDFVFGNLLV
jgi:hypothetical protein